MAEGRFAGVDWASEEHAVCVVDESGRIVDGRRYKHTEAGLRALCSRLTALKVAIERQDGLLIERLLDAGLTVIAVRANQVRSAGPRYTWAGIDLHRRRSQIAFIDEHGEITQQRIATGRRRSPTRSVILMTPMSRWRRPTVGNGLLIRLTGAGFDVHVAHPLRTRAIAAVRRDAAWRPPTRPPTCAHTSARCNPGRARSCVWPRPRTLETDGRRL